MNKLTVREAFEAVEHAQETIDGCESIDELDTASDFHEAFANCPKGFSQAQRDLAHEIILKAWMKSVGRA